MAPNNMATRWLGVWLTGVGLHGLRPADHEPLLRWLLSLHERAIAEHEAALEGLSPEQAAAADQILREAIAAPLCCQPALLRVVVAEAFLPAAAGCSVVVAGPGSG